MKKWLISFSILTVTALALFLAGKTSEPSLNRPVLKLPGGAPGAESVENSGEPQTESGGSTTAVLAPSAPNTSSVSTAPAAGAPVYTEAQPPDTSKQKALNDKAELEKFKSLNKAYTAKVEQLMKTNEIASLRQSIAEDEQTLKKIEASGTDIEGYKFVEKNLQARKARLKKLLQ